MKTVLSVMFILAAGLAPAGEFLGVIPDITPNAAATAFTVVGQTANGVLVLGEESESDALTAAGGRVVALNPREGDFYRVHLLTGADPVQLTAAGELLYFDGENYILRAGPDGLDKLLVLRAMFSRLSLRPMTLRADAPVLPRVTSNPTVQAIVNEVSPDSVLAVVRRLQQYRTRYSTGDSCRAAVQWVMDKFRAYGCDSVYLQTYSGQQAPNVIGIKYGTQGTRNPYAIICGHIDSYAQSNAPGADDNASGTASATECARVTRNYEFVKDMRYIAFSGEELGLLGSEAYANAARARGDSILGVFNFDMIGYVDVAPESLELVTKINNPPCTPFSDFFIACADTYTTLLCQKIMVNDNQNSDHGPFWDNGYLAFCGIEDFWPVNPHYHTSHDSIGAGYNNNAWCTEVIKAGIAGIATICEPVPMNVPQVGYLRSRIDDAAGNNDGFWDPGESIGVYLTLKNFGMVAAHSVQATVSTTDSFVTLFAAAHPFGDLDAQDSAINAAPYLMRARANTPREHSVRFSLAITSAESTWQSSFTLQVGRYLVTDPIPDGPRTPALYWAYDDVDAGYPEHPTYDWVEIKTTGTRIPYPSNDNVVMLSIPSGFGPFKFYGQRYTQLSISADGWICPGNYTTGNYQNTPLPNSATPPGLIALNWDDLHPDYNSRGYVYYYHDAPNHRLVIEYDSVAYYSPNSLRDKFQAIIYDTTLAAPSGDNVVVAQYMTANGYSSSTVGIQNQNRTIAIQDLYNAAYTHGAAPIVAGRAIKYTTVAGTGLAEGSRGLPRARLLALAVAPNPVRGAATIRFQLAEAGPVALGLFDPTGREVRTLLNNRLGAGDHEVRWDARDLPGGIYFVRLARNDKKVTTKVVIARE